VGFPNAIEIYIKQKLAKSCFSKEFSIFTEVNLQAADNQ